MANQLEAEAQAEQPDEPEPPEEDGATAEAQQAVAEKYAAELRRIRTPTGLRKWRDRIDSEADILEKAKELLLNEADKVAKTL